MKRVYGNKEYKYKNMKKYKIRTFVVYGFLVDSFSPEGMPSALTMTSPKDLFGETE